MECVDFQNCFGQIWLRLQHFDQNRYAGNGEHPLYASFLCSLRDGHNFPHKHAMSRVCFKLGNLIQNLVLWLYITYVVLIFSAEPLNIVIYELFFRLIMWWFDTWPSYLIAIAPIYPLKCPQVPMGCMRDGYEIGGMSYIHTINCRRWPPCGPWGDQHSGLYIVVAWIPALINNYTHYHDYEMWDEFTYPFPNFKGKVFSSHTIVGMWLLIHDKCDQHGNLRILLACIWALSVPP